MSGESHIKSINKEMDRNNMAEIIVVINTFTIQLIYCSDTYLKRVLIRSEDLQLIVTSSIQTTFMYQ